MLMLQMQQSPSKKILKSVSSNKLKNKSPFYKNPEKDRMKEAIDMYIAYVKNNNAPPQQQANLNKKASERKLRKFLSNEIHTKVNLKHDTLIDKYSKWKVNQSSNNEKVTQFSSAAEILNQANDSKVVAQVKQLFPSIYQQSRNPAGEQLINDKNETKIKNNQFNSILMTETKESVLEQSGPKLKVNGSLIYEEVDQTVDEGDNIIDRESKIIFNVKKKKNSRKKNKSQLSNISSRGGRNQSLEYPQNPIAYSNQVQVQKITDNKILPQLNYYKFSESPQGKKNKEIFDKIDTTFTKQHQITKQEFFKKGQSKKNQTINLEQELQDKKLINKLKLIQKHNEGIQDLINLPTPHKIKSQRQNLQSPETDAFELKLKLVASESQASLQLPELDKQNKFKNQERVPLSKSQMQVQKNKSPRKLQDDVNQNHLSQSQSLDVILSARNAKSSIINKALEGESQVKKVNKGDNAQLQKASPIKIIKEKIPQKRDSSNQRAAIQNINTDQQPNSNQNNTRTTISNQTSYLQTRKNENTDRTSLKNKFKQLMRFNTNEDLEQIEYEMQILDKLLEQKSQLNKMRNGNGQLINNNVKNQDEEQSNTKRGKVVFNLSKNETNLIYKEE
ncbi:UNKNOWN [Stylonychia lemnae]|uniref:Uncharacterized protein n=1 Tax=Stylonychia lemnae TaxID=5949 RepID=A0A078A4S1_STYLE|nr:UNKNOWN [Stylonychia lemnae]|eukprot:CDW77270.1 UNKNOWN [Stylonychia lemnae]